MASVHDYFWLCVELRSVMPDKAENVHNYSRTGESSCSALRGECHVLWTNAAQSEPEGLEMT